MRHIIRHLTSLLAFCLLPLGVAAQLAGQPVRPVSSDARDQMRRFEQQQNQKSALVTRQGEGLLRPLHVVTDPTRETQSARQLVSSDATAPAERPTLEAAMPTEICGMLVYSTTWNGNGSGKYGVYSFKADDSSTLTALKKDDLFNVNGGGIYENGRYHVVSYSAWYSLILSYSYYQFDTEDWKTLQQVSGTETHTMIVDGDYDASTGNLYAIMYSDNLQSQVFGTVDYATNSRKIICNLDSNFLAFAVSPLGQCYAIRADGMLVQIDKTNGKQTNVGSTGIQPMYLQSAAFDPKTGKMYWAACVSAGDNALYEVNTSTGAVTLVKTFKNKEEFVGLYIPAPLADEDAPAAPSNLTATYAQDHLDGYVRFRMPKKSYSGDALEGELGYKIFFNDVLMAEGTATAGSMVTDSVTVETAGMYVIRVCAVNEAGEGVKPKLEKYIGADAPTAPKNVTLKRGEGQYDAVLTWNAPTTGVNSGYVRADSVNYAVVRMPDNVTVATALRERTFSETLQPQQLENYWYVVTAYNADIQGESASSNHVAYGECKEVPYYEDFEDQSVVANMFTIIDNNNDGNTWKAGTWNDGTRDVYYQYHATNDADDWLITPAIHLQGGRFYHFGFNASSSFYGEERVEAAFGPGNTVADMTTTVVEPYSLPSYDGVDLSGVVKVDQEGTYYFGIHGISPADAGILDIDNIFVTDGGSFSAPDTVTGFKVTPAAKGRTHATVRFRAPEVNFYGDPIDTIDSIVIYRGSTVFTTIKSPTPGRVYSNLDTKAGNGNVTYSVYAYNSYGCGIPAQRTVWVGVDIPDEPQNLTLTDRGTTILLEWDAPTTGVHGGYIDPSALTYNIENSDSYIKGTNRAGTTFSESIDATKQRTLYYRVSAQSSAGGGNYAYSNTILAGSPYQLPFSESFAGATTEQFWSQQNTGGEVGLTTGISADNDGGSAVFNPTGKGQVGMITSGKISLKKADYPKLSFYYYALPGKTQTLTVGVLPNGDSEKLTAVKVINYAQLTGEEGWRKEEIDLTQFRENGYIILTFIGQTTGTNVGAIAFDNILIREHYATDLAACFDMNQYLNAGDTIKAQVRIDNVGREACSAFSVEFYQNGEFIEEVKGSAVEADASTAVLCEIPTLVTDESPMQLKAVVKANGDGDETNNSDSVSIILTLPPYPVPENIEGALSGDNLTLAWQQPDLSDRNIYVTDSFDLYTPFIINNIGPWTTLDLDGVQTATMSAGSSTLNYLNAGKAMAYQVFNPAEAGISWEAIQAHSGSQMLVNIKENSGKSDDWLISPCLGGHAQTVTFWVRSVGVNYLESFSVLASSTDMETSSFQELSPSITTAPIDWTQVSVELPEGTRYFAIRTNTEQKFMLMIDDITWSNFNAADLQLVGYNVWRDGQCITDEPVSVAEFHELAPLSGCTYQVSAVYTVGESALSSPYSFNATGIGAQLLPSGVTLQGRQIIVDNPAAERVIICTSDGKQLLPATRENLVKLTVQPGVYVVRLGARTVKLAVR